MRVITIFLASSETLKKFRDQLNLDIASKNKRLIDKELILELVIWEDLSAKKQLTRSQDSYNREIKKCDMFVLLASNRIGQYTKEEYSEANKLFQDTGKPQIFIYLEKDVAAKEQSLIDFEKELAEEEHFPAFYTNYDNLWNQLNTEIDRLLDIIQKNQDPRTDTLKLPKELGNIPIKPIVFKGREGKLSAIYHAFFEEDHHIVMLTGDGGMGKTTVASKYYYEYKEYYSHLIWAIAQSGLVKALLDIAPVLRVEFDNTATLQEQIEEVLKTINILQKPVLLVIDNVDDYDDLVKNHSYLLKTDNIHILITSRLSSFTEFNRIEIKKLTPQKAKELFLHYYKNYTPDEAPLLERVLRAIGYNTLVVEILSKNLQKTKLFGYNLEHLLKDLQHEGVLGIKKSSSVAHTYHDLKETKPQKIIEAMYNIVKLNEEELKLLSLFSLLPETTLSFEELLRFSTFEEERLMTLLQNLTDTAWLSTDDTQNGFEINTIIADIIRTKQKDKLYTTALPMIKALKEDLDYELNTGTVPNYNQATKALHFATTLLTFIKEKTCDIAILYERIGNFYQHYGNILLALENYKKETKLFEELYEDNPNQVGFKNGLAISYERLGNIHQSLGEMQKALAFFEKETKLFEELYEENPNQVGFKNGLAVSYSKLGDIHQSLGETQKALVFFEKDMKLTEELYKENPKQVSFKNGLAISYSKLYEFYFAQKECAKAKEYATKCYALFKEIYENAPLIKEFQDNYRWAKGVMEMLEEECG